MLRVVVVHVVPLQTVIDVSLEFDGPLPPMIVAPVPLPLPLVPPLPPLPEPFVLPEDPPVDTLVPLLLLDPPLAVATELHGT